MGLADQMQNMTDSFLHAHDLRANQLKEIAEETNGDLVDTRKMMRDLHTERLENADTLQKTLGQFADALTKEVDQAIKGFRTARRHMGGELHEQLEKLTETIAKETRDTLRGFRATHKALSGQQREDLAKFVKSLEAEAEDLCKAAQVTMKAFHKDQQKMSRELRESLSGFAAQNHKRAAQYLRGCNTQRLHTAEAQRESLAQGVAGNAKETAQLRKRFRTEQNKRVEELREQTESFLKSVRQTVRQMKKAAHELIGGFHEDHRKAQHAWQQMAISMEKKRNDGPEETAAASGVGRHTERENALVKLLKETPEGMTLAELSYAMEMPSAATSKTLKHMLKRKDTAIRRKGPLYLAS
jgi:hypothetical protein